MFLYRKTIFLFILNYKIINKKPFLLKFITIFRNRIYTNMLLNIVFSCTRNLLTECHLYRSYYLQQK